MKKFLFLLVISLAASSFADPINDGAKEMKSLDDALNDLIQASKDDGGKLQKTVLKEDTTTEDTEPGSVTEAKGDTTDAETVEKNYNPDDDVADPIPEESNAVQLNSDSETFSDPQTDTEDLVEENIQAPSEDVANDPYSSASKTVILCEGSKGRLHCPSGTRIFITAANYGRTTGRSVCPHSSIKTTSCRARLSLIKVRQACHNKISCALYSTNSVFGDPCVGTYKYLQVSFRCRQNAPPVPAECRFGGRSGYKWLTDRDRAQGHVLQGSVKCDRTLPTAWYRFGGLAGRDLPISPPSTRRCQTHAPGWFQGRLPTARYQQISGKVCFHWSNNRCRWSTKILVRNCGVFRVYRLQKTPQCSLRYCGDRKQALPTPIFTRRVCERSSYSLRCPGNKKISVVYANYGRTTGRSVCPNNSMKTTRCLSSYSNKLLRCACHGQNRCYLHASNAVFGDPCVGTYKYIEIRYRCN